MHRMQVNLRSNDTSGIFNWHPLLMTLAFPVLMGEAVMAYRTPMAPNLEQCAPLPSPHIMFLALCD